MQLSTADGCFACGPQNPHGLQLDFRVDETSRSLRTCRTPLESYQGYSGILHGGLVATAALKLIRVPS